jgi:hypothetical protein
LGFTKIIALRKVVDGVSNYLQEDGTFSDTNTDYKHLESFGVPTEYSGDEFSVVQIKTLPESEMNYLLLDTNVWLYMLNNLYNDNGKFLDALIRLHLEGEIQIVLSEQVEIEFFRNYETVFSRVMHNYDSKITQFVDIVHKLDIAVYYADQWIDKIKKAKDNYIKDSYGMRLEKIARVFEDFKSFKIATSNQVRIHAAELALEKTPPFFGSLAAPKGDDPTVKNSMGDAIIFLGYLEFLKGKTYKSAYFISANSTDFCEPGSNSLHHKLNELIAEANVDLKFDSLLAKYINLIDGNILKSQPFPQNPNREFECEVCKTKYNIDINKYVDHSKLVPSLVWWHRCPHCFAMYETDEDFAY